MKHHVNDVKAGDNVFLYQHSSRYPSVVPVVRTTANFVFIGAKRYPIKDGQRVEEIVEVKYRRDGTGMERFDGCLKTIEDGDVEKFEKEKAEDKRIGEILSLLSSKGFKFNGHENWYTIEQWEKLASAFA